MEEEPARAGGDAVTMERLRARLEAVQALVPEAETEARAAVAKAIADVDFIPPWEWKYAGLKASARMQQVMGTRTEAWAAAACALWVSPMEPSMDALRQRWVANPAGREGYVTEGNGHTVAEFMPPDDHLKAQLGAAAPDLARVARATLLFLSAGSWGQKEQTEWEELTGRRDATSRALAECAREALKNAGI